MNDQDYNQLRELSWRRSLTPTEETELQQYLTAHPAARPDWQTEAALNQLLARLPDAPPVASNFTARVLQAAQLEAAARTRAPSRSGFQWRGLWNWLPKAAAVGLVISLASLSYHHQQMNHRAALNKNMAELAAAVSSDPQMMEDFEPIRRLSDPQPKADTELLALLK